MPCYGSDTIMNEREYQRLRARIEREYREKLQALDTVWKMARQETAKASANGAAKGALLEGVRYVVPTLNGDFTLRDVERAMRTAGLTVPKRASLSSALKRLAEGGELETVQPGKGKRASIYRSKEGAAAET